MSLSPFEFGTIVTDDYSRATVMVLAVAPDQPRLDRTTYLAVVIEDSDHPGPFQWHPGEIISLSPDDHGLRIVAEPEEGP